MEIKLLLDKLQDTNDELAYAAAKEIAAESEFSDKYYKYIPDFVKLLNHKKSYIRTRALIIICSQARWDDQGIIAQYLSQILNLIHDDKPTVVRQSLNAIKEIIVFRPELCDTVSSEVDKIDLLKYRESMSSLIQKDIDEVKELLN